MTGQCAYPIHVNGVYVPCGRCMGCRIARTREWTVRLLHELPYHECATFLTLTYDEEHIPVMEKTINDVPIVVNNTLKKKDLINFFRRLKNEPQRKFKYFACGEYGDITQRPHYHAIVYGLHPEEKELVLENWKYGLVDLGIVNAKTARYTAKYIQKKLNGEMAEEEYGAREHPFQIQSNGIGKQYALDNEKKLKEHGYCILSGAKVGIPKYYQKILGITTEHTIKHVRSREKATREALKARGIEVFTPKQKDAALAPYRAQSDINKRARISLNNSGQL
jgi:hypothetical protein